jgi:ATP-dependent Clp protease ATP-binding subunit ClpA
MRPSFKALDHDIILRVVDKFLMQLEEQLHEKKVEATSPSALKPCWPSHGFDPLMGARPMAAPDPGHHPLCAGRRTAVRQIES